MNENDIGFALYQFIKTVKYYLRMKLKLIQWWFYRFINIYINKYTHYYYIVKRSIKHTRLILELLNLYFNIASNVDMNMQLISQITTCYHKYNCCIHVTKRSVSINLKLPHRMFDERASQPQIWLEINHFESYNYKYHFQQLHHYYTCPRLVPVWFCCWFDVREMQSIIRINTTGVSELIVDYLE